MARPPHSSWREYEAPDPNNPLEQNGELKKEFWEAKTAQEPLETQQEQEIPIEQQRPTSLAKEYLEKRADSALDQTRDLSPEFNSVSENERAKLEERASRMVEEDQPELKPRPTNEMAERADRVSFDDRWEREQNEAEHTNDKGLER